MNALQVISDIKTAGGKIYLLDGVLKLSANRGAVTPRILADAKTHKAEIINILSVESETTAPKSDAPTPGRLTPKNGNRLSPVALSWLKDHREALRAAGWTARELYRRNKSPGICWCTLWEMPFLKVYLHDDGVIEFEAVIAGRDIIQTARPMHRARKI